MEFSKNYVSFYDTRLLRISPVIDKSDCVIKSELDLLRKEMRHWDTSMNM